MESNKCFSIQIDMKEKRENNDLLVSYKGFSKIKTENKWENKLLWQCREAN